VFVKDTKFERQQHEATGRHQGGIRRSLKDLHRDQEIEARKKSQAQAEIARLNGLVPSASASPTVATGLGDKPTFKKREPEKKATVEDRKKQWEQLAAMGVALPEEARSDMGMAGDWKVVAKQVVGEVDANGDFKEKQLNKGVHKRKLDEHEEESAAAGEIITKRKGWGHTYKTFPGSKGGDDDIESLFATKKPEVKVEESQVKAEDPVKDEEETAALHDIPTAEEAEAKAAEATIKKEEDAPAAPAVVFKKRKKIAK
jgi:ribosomal protein L27